MSKISMDPEVHLELLKRVAESLAIRFHCPFYLVGSFSEKGMQALDLDVIMVLDDDRFIRLFREFEYNERRHRFIAKQKKAFEDCVPWDVDFKVQRAKDFYKYTGKRSRLDSDKWADAPKEEVCQTETKLTRSPS